MEMLDVHIVNSCGCSTSQPVWFFNDLTALKKRCMSLLVQKYRDCPGSEALQKRDAVLPEANRSLGKEK